MEHFVFPDQQFQLLGGRGHPQHGLWDGHQLQRFPSLSSRHQPLRESPRHGGVQAQELKAEHGGRLTDDLLHPAVVHDVSLAQLHEAGPLPVPVMAVVVLLRLVHALLRPPGPEQGHPGVQPWLGREDQHKGRQVGTLGQVQPAIAPLPPQELPYRAAPVRGFQVSPLRPVPLGLVIQCQWNPAHRLGGDPLVEPQPAEQLFRRFAFFGCLSLQPQSPQGQVLA